jgi:N utilization substance protein A
MEPADETPSAMFQRVLRIGRPEAEALEAEGFTSLDEVAYVPFNEMLEVPGLTEAAAMSMRNAARAILLRDALGGFEPPEGGIDA